MPGLFYFNKIYQLVEQAGKKPVTNILPLAGFDVSRVSSKAISAGDPTVIDVVLDLVYLINRPP